MGRDPQGLIGTIPGSSGVARGQEILARDSALVLDVDRRAVRALLFDVVDGSARFVGLGTVPSTIGGTWVSQSAGITGAIEQLEHETGRRLYDGASLISPQHGNGDGVDAFFLTGAPIEPNQAAVVSVGRGETSRAIVSGVRRTPTVLADATETLAAGGAGYTQPSLLGWLRQVAPTTVILVADGGTAEDWNIALEAIADWSRDSATAQGIVVADEARQQSAAQSLGHSLELSGIDPRDYERWEIAAALEAEFRGQYDRRVEASDVFRLLPSATFVDRMQAVQAVAAFLHRRMGRNIVAASIGDGALLHVASSSGGVTVNRADRDLGLGARGLHRIAAEQITRWLPFRWSPEEVTQWLLNRTLRPFTEPESSTDLLVAAAARREVLASLTQDAGLGDDDDIDLIAVDPALSAEDPALALLTVLDGVSPQSADGLVTVASDAEGLMSAAGAIAATDPSYASEVIEQDFLSLVASCIVVDGQGDLGALAARGEIRYANGESQRFSVPFGNLHVLPLADGESAELVVAPEPGFRVGRHSEQETVSFTGDHQVFGGRIGVVIDARGRPVRLPDDPEARSARLRAWLSDLGSQLA